MTQCVKTEIVRFRPLRSAEVRTVTIEGLSNKSIALHNSPMKMITSKTFWTAFWSGIASPGIVLAADMPKISKIEAPACQSDRDAMRSDWVKIGQDFSRVIQRETSQSK